MALKVQWTQYGLSDVDITSQVDFEALTIEQNASGINAIARFDVFTLLPFSTEFQHVKRDFAIRDLIRIYDDGLSGDEQWLFSGFLTGITPKQEGDHVVQTLEIADYTSIFDAVVIDDMTIGQKTAYVTNAQKDTPSAGYITYTADNDFLVGDKVTITGAVSSEFNCAEKPITARSATTFTVQKGIDAVNITGAVANSPSDGYTTYTSTNTLAAGDTVTVGNITPTAFNATNASVYSATTSAFVIANSGATALISSVSPGTTTVIYTTTAAHNFAIGNLVKVSNVVPTAFNVTSGTITAVTSNTFTVTKTVSRTTITNVQLNTPTTGKMTYTTSGTNPYTTGLKVSTTGIEPNEFNLSAQDVTASAAGSFVVDKDVPGFSVTDATAASPAAGSVKYFGTGINLTEPYGKLTVTGVTPSSFNVTGATVTAATSTSVTVTSNAGTNSITAAAPNTPAADQVSYTAANTYTSGNEITIAGSTTPAYDITSGTVISATSTAFVVSNPKVNASIQSVAANTPSSGSVTYYTTAAHYFAVGNVVTVAGITPSTFNGTSMTITGINTGGTNSFYVTKATTATTVTNIQPNTPTTGKTTYTVPLTNTLTTGKVTVTGASPSEFNASGAPITASTTTSFVIDQTNEPLTVTDAVPNGTSIVYYATNSLASPYGKATIAGISSGSGTSPLNVTGVAVTGATSSTVTVASTAGYASITGIAVDTVASTVTYTANNTFSVGDIVDITGITPSIFTQATATVTARTATTFTISKAISANTITGVSATGGSITYAATGHNLVTGGKVTTTNITPTQYNLTAQSVTGTTANSFTISSSVGQYGAITGVTTVANATVHTLQYTVANALAIGNVVTVSGISSGGAASLLNQSSATVTAASIASFTINVATNPGGAGQWQLTAGARITPAAGQTEFTTSAPHNLTVGDRVTVTGVTGNTGYNFVNLPILGIRTPTTFYVTLNPSTATATFSTASWVAQQFLSGTGSTAILQYASGGSAIPAWASGGAYTVDYVSGGSLASVWSSGGSAVPAYSSGGTGTVAHAGTTGRATIPYGTGGTAVNVYDTGGSAQYDYVSGGNAGAVYVSGGSNVDIYTSGGTAYSQSATGIFDTEVIDEIFMHQDGVTGLTVWEAAGLNHQPTKYDYNYVKSDSQYLFSNPSTYIVEKYQGMTVHQAIDYITSKTGYSYWIDEAKNFHYGKTTTRDIMPDGSAYADLSGWTSAPSGTTLTRQTSGGPYNSGSSIKYSLTTANGVNEVKYMITPTNAIPDSYMVMFWYKTSTDNEAASAPTVLIRWYSAANALLKETSMPLTKNQSSWRSDWMLSMYSGATAATKVEVVLSLGASGATADRNEFLQITGIQVVPIDTTFGFLETGKSVVGHGDANDFTWQSYENPETAVEGAQSKNIVRIYGAWEDPDTHDVYNEYEHPRGVWALKGRRVYGNVFDQSVIDDAGAGYRAAGTFEKEGVPLRTVQFDHQEEHTLVRAGNVVPFVWETGDIAEPLLVRENSAKWQGTRLFWSTTLGGDPTITKTSIYALNARLQDLQQYLLDAVAPEPPPAVVLTSGAVAIDADGNTSVPVKATWNINLEPDFRSYKVQFSSGDSGAAALSFTNPIEQTISRKQFGNTGAPTTVEASTLAPTGKYIAARVSSTDFMANASGAAVSPAVLTPVDTIAPSDPTGLLATSTIASILISWEFDATLPGNRDFKQYVLQRVSSTNTTFPGWTSGSLATFVYENSSVVHPVTAEGGSATSENSVYSRNYWYRVAAKDTAGNQSGWAYVDDLATPTSAQMVSAGTVNSVDIGSITADSITTGTLDLNGGEGVSITADGFTLSTNGIMTAKSITVSDTAVGPGIISKKGAGAGDFSVPTGETVQIGHWAAASTAESITGVTLNSPSSGYTKYTASNAFAVNQIVDITGISPSSFNIAQAVIAGANSNSFWVKVSKTGTYVSGGTATATSGTFTSRINIDSAGVVDITSGNLTLNGTAVGSGSSTIAGGRVVGVQYDPGTAGGVLAGALEFYAGAVGTIPGTYRGRIRASDSVAGRLVFESTESGGDLDFLVNGDVTVSGTITTSGNTLTTGNYYPGTQTIGYITATAQGRAYYAGGTRFGSSTMQLVTKATSYNTGGITSSPAFSIAGQMDFWSTNLNAERFYWGSDQTGGMQYVAATAASDIRVKDNVEDFTISLNELLSLRSISFTYKGSNSADRRLIGVIAQELQEISPWLVSEETLGVEDNQNQYVEDGKLLYPELTSASVLSIAIDAMRQLNEKIENLERKVKELEG